MFDIKTNNVLGQYLEVKMGQINFGIEFGITGKFRTSEESKGGEDEEIVE